METVLARPTTLRLASICFSFSSAFGSEPTHTSRRAQIDRREVNEMNETIKLNWIRNATAFSAPSRLAERSIVCCFFSSREAKPRESHCAYTRNTPCTHFSFCFCRYHIFFLLLFVCRFIVLIWMCAKRLTRNRRIFSAIFSSSFCDFSRRRKNSACEKLQKKSKKKMKNEQIMMIVLLTKLWMCVAVGSRWFDVQLRNMVALTLWFLPSLDWWWNCGLGLVLACAHRDRSNSNYRIKTFHLHGSFASKQLLSTPTDDARMQMQICTNARDTVNTIGRQWSRRSGRMARINII